MEHFTNRSGTPGTLIFTVHITPDGYKRLFFTNTTDSYENRNGLSAKGIGNYVTEMIENYENNKED